MFTIKVPNSSLLPRRRRVTTALSVRRHVEDNEVNMGLLHPQSSCMGKHLDYNKLVWSMLFLWFYARSKTVKWNSWEKAETVTLTHAARIPLRIQDLVVVKWYRIDFNSPELANRQKTNMKIAGVCFFFFLSLSLLLTLQMQIYHSAGVSCSEWSKWACVTGNKSGHTPVRRSRGEQFQTTCGTCVRVRGGWMNESSPVM